MRPSSKITHHSSRTINMHSAGAWCKSHPAVVELATTTTRSPAELSAALDKAFDEKGGCYAEFVRWASESANAEKIWSRSDTDERLRAILVRVLESWKGAGQ